MLHSPGSIIIDFGELFNLNRSLPLRWYGLLTGLGFLAAFLVINSRASRPFKKDSEQIISEKKESWQITEIQKQNLFDLLFICFIGGIIGARLWYVILSWNYFAHNTNEILQIWQGGQSIQGGIFGGFVSALLVYQFKKSQNKLSDLPPFKNLADLIALGLPIGQAIGRWGNFFNNEAFGKPTQLPWAQFIPPEFRPEKYLGYISFHPTFLYESIYMLLVFFFLLSLHQSIINEKEQKLNIFGLQLNLPFKISTGSLFPIYLILYSIGRFFLEFIRLDSLLIGSFPAAQIICVFMIIVSIGILVFTNCREIPSRSA
jgi:phosphatidylglycerol:prolipoprotein diacylglycerol transferase